MTEAEDSPKNRRERREIFTIEFQEGQDSESPGVSGTKHLFSRRASHQPEVKWTLQNAEQDDRFSTSKVQPPLFLQIIHISDTHFGPNRDHTIRGAAVANRVEMLVRSINELSFQPDFVIHTGDVVNAPDENAYRLAESVLSKLKAPVFYATGNHDDQSMMRAALTFGSHTPLLTESDEICYQIDHPDFDLFVMDGKVPEEEGPHGFLSEAQMEAVLDAVRPKTPVAVFLHFPLLNIASRWIDEHLPVKNGEEFHQILREKAGTNLRGVFTGHLHRGLQIYRDQVLYSGVSSPACEFTAGPDDDFCDFLPDCAVPFNHVTMTREATVVKSYALPFHGK